MNKLTSIFMTALLFSSFMGPVYASDSHSEHLGGQALLKKSEEQIEKLNAKKEELEHEGGDGKVIDRYVEINKRLITVNNQRHELHQATKEFAKAVDIFSANLEDDIKELEGLIEEAAEGAINNAKIAALARPKTAKDEEEKEEK